MRPDLEDVDVDEVQELCTLAWEESEALRKYVGDFLKTQKVSAMGIVFLLCVIEANLREEVEKWEYCKLKEKQ